MTVASTTPSATPAWTDDEPARPLPFWPSVRADALAHLAGAPGPCTRLGWTWWALKLTLRSSGFHVTLVYRLAHTCSHRLGLAGRILAGVLFWWNRHFASCAIASTARLHGGLILPHPQGIVIGAGVVVGPRAWLFQNVTLGGTPGKAGLPTVGADARIFSGAVLAGPIAVGDNVMIGANAVVVRDVPTRTLVRSAAVEYLPLPDRFHHNEPPPDLSDQP